MYVIAGTFFFRYTKRVFGLVSSGFSSATDIWRKGAITSANSPGRLLVRPGSAVTATAGSVAASTMPLRSVMSPRDGSSGSFWVSAAADSAA